MKVFVDTNFLLSALATNGLSAEIFDKLVEEHQVIYSRQVLDEFIEKLKTKFKVPIELIEQVIERLSPLELMEDYHQIHYSLRDQDDEVILATAVYCGASILITGDKDLLSIKKEVKELEILSPREFWQKFSD